VQKNKNNKASKVSSNETTKLLSLFLCSPLYQSSVLNKFLSNNIPLWYGDIFLTVEEIIKADERYNKYGRNKETGETKKWVKKHNNNSIERHN